MNLIICQVKVERPIPVKGGSLIGWSPSLQCGNATLAAESLETTHHPSFAFLFFLDEVQILQNILRRTELKCHTGKEIAPQYT